MTGGLPKGWDSISLAKTVIPQKGKKPTVLRDRPENGFVPYLDIYAIERNEIRRYAEVKSSKLSKNGDLYVVWDGARSGWVGGGVTGAIGSTIMAITPLCVDSNFLKHFIASHFHTLNSNTRGTGIPHVDPEIFWNLEVPLPPLPEQQRIVAKLERLLDRVNSCQQRLAKIPVLLKRFRQSVLAAACSGCLTADWRGENNINYDFEKTTIESIADYIGGYAYKSPTFLEAGEHQVIRIGNIRPLALNLDVSPVFIPYDIAEQTQRFKLSPNDIIISMTGTRYKQDYGYASLVKEIDENLFLNQRLARLRRRNSVSPKFLLFWLQTDTFRNFFFSGETGNVNQGNVGADSIRKAPIELPPLPEQEEIVRRVESLFSLADQIESRLAKATDQVNRLTSSILAKAFKGELVPQDPDDEPASVLLERVRQSRKPKEKKRGGRSLQEEIKQNGLLSGTVPKL